MPDEESAIELAIEAKNGPAAVGRARVVPELDVAIAPRRLLFYHRLRSEEPAAKNEKAASGGLENKCVASPGAAGLEAVDQLGGWGGASPDCESASDDSGLLDVAAFGDEGLGSLPCDRCLGDLVLSCHRLGTCADARGFSSLCSADERQERERQGEEGDGPFHGAKLARFPYGFPKRSGWEGAIHARGRACGPPPGASPLPPVQRA